MKNNRKCNYFSMTLGEVLLRSTLITMAPSVFQKTNFKGYFSHSQTSKCLMRFFGSGTGPWAQISWEGTIFDAKHDDRKIFPIFENFGKSRNKVWVPPIIDNPRFFCIDIHCTICQFSQNALICDEIQGELCSNSIDYKPLQTINLYRL